MKFYLFKKTIYNCKQATFLITKKSEQKLSIAENLKLFYHLLFCDPCKEFAKQSHIIDGAMHDCQETLSQHPPHVLPEAAKKKIQEMIDSN
jgi:hypothetical protein